MSDHPETIITPDPPRAPTVGARPYWMPDTRGFLAGGIWLMIAGIVFFLLLRPVQMDERVSNLLSTILGILIGCFKDVYSFSFNSTQSDQDKNKTIADANVALAGSVPAAVVAPTVQPERQP